MTKCFYMDQKRQTAIEKSAYPELFVLKCATLSPPFIKLSFCVAETDSSWAQSFGPRAGFEPTKIRRSVEGVFTLKKEA